MKTRMVTSSEVIGFAQGPLLIVQRSTLVPWPRLFTAVKGFAALAKVALPLTTVHWPVAGKVGALPASVVLMVGVQRL